MTAKVGIFYGTSTGNTETVAQMIHDAFGNDIAAEPIDVDTLLTQSDNNINIWNQYNALIVGTPTWNTGADTERSGTGWDELLYKHLSQQTNNWSKKKVAVFGLGDQVSYAENYADATGELYAVFESLNCQMLGAWSMEGYEHVIDSKSILSRDRQLFCGLLLDMINQEEMTLERVEQWVKQLVEEGILEENDTTVSSTTTTVSSSPMDAQQNEQEQFEILQQNSALLDQTIGAHASGGFTPHYNPVSGRTMWISANGRESYVTTTTTSVDTLQQQKTFTTRRLNP